MSPIKRRLLELLTAEVEHFLPRFDEKTGRFLSDPGGPIAPGAKEEDLYWIVINQDIMYALATLYTEPESPSHGEARLLDIACRAGDAVRDFQYPDGQVEFIKPDGSKWGPTYMGWTNYAWLETYALLGDHLGKERQRRWEEGLTLAHDGQARELRTAGVHNIPCWKAMSCYRAGQIFDRPDWMEVGQAMIDKAVAEQQPGGYWAEHGGPTTLYNLVYVHALGLHYVFSGDDKVLPALRAATDFHQTFTYPDGSGVETVDGRVKYHERVARFALTAFSLFPEGRRYAHHLLAAMESERDFGSPQGGCLASAYHHFPEGEEGPINLDQPSFRKTYRDWAVVWREKPWFACLSAFVCPPVASRWGQDRQNFLSLWHEKTGLIIGGGNSKDQPEWSTFIADGRYVPDRGELAEDGEGIILTYGNVRCHLQLSLEAEAVTITASSEGGPAVQQLLLHNLKQGQKLRTAAGTEAVAGDQAIDWRTDKLGAWLQIGDCRIEAPHGAHLRWPSLAFNPYAADGAAPYGSESGVLAAPIDTAPITWRVTTG